MNRYRRHTFISAIAILVAAGFAATGYAKGWTTGDVISFFLVILFAYAVGWIVGGTDGELF